MDEKEDLDLDKEGGEDEAAAPAGGGRRSLIIRILQFGIGGALLLIIMILIAVAVSTVVMKSNTPKMEGAVATKKAPPHANHDVGDFNMALAPSGDGQQHFIQTKIVLAYDEELRVKLSPELGKRSEQIKGLINAILIKKRYSDLVGEDSLDRLKEEILAAVNQTLVEGQLRDVYFTSFVVQ